MTPCDKVIGGDGVSRRRCRKPARYVFTGVAGQRSLPHAVKMRRAYCVLHSGKGLLSEGALPGWVDEVVDLREVKHA